MNYPDISSGYWEGYMATARPFSIKVLVKHHTWGSEWLTSQLTRTASAILSCCLAVGAFVLCRSICANGWFDAFPLAVTHLQYSPSISQIVCSLIFYLFATTTSCLCHVWYNVYKLNINAQVVNRSLYTAVNVRILLWQFFRMVSNCLCRRAIILWEYYDANI